MQGVPPQKLIERYNKLKGARGNWESVWQEIANYILPTKDNITKHSSPGEAKYNQILDSTAMISLEYLAGALHGMLTSPTSVFFNLSTGDPELDSADSVRLWIQDTVRRMHDQLNSSNFQTEVHEYYLDLGGFGNGALFMEEDVEEVVRFSSWPLGEVLIDENHKGQIDTCFRMFKMTAKDVVDEFGEKGLPSKITDCYKNGRTDEFEVLHTIYPKSAIPYKTNIKFPYISQYSLSGDNIDLSIKGFREFPLIFGRWSKVSGEKYGRGPGERALPEAKTLNEMTKTTIRGAQKVVDPPLQAPDDGFVLPLVTIPAGINYYRAGSNDRIEPLFNDSRIDFGFQMIDSKRAQIREAFYVNQLQLREGPQMTATEVSQRVEQALRFLAPMLGRQQSEFLGPMVQRLYGIMNRRGLFKEVPPELNGIPLNVVYSSVMAASQRMSEMQNINRTLASIQPLAAIDPSVMDNVATDKGLRHIARIQNFPQEMLRTQNEVTSIRESRAEAQSREAELQEQEVRSKSIANVMGAANKAPPAV